MGADRGDTADRLNRARAPAAGDRGGTTSLRLLESAAGEDNVIRPFAGDTSIFITPAIASARSTG
jgi:S-adenosylmethionine:tRNA ribosyltransferase-isomerase